MDNFTIINGNVFRITNALCSFVLSITQSENIQYYGYSSVHKKLFVQMTNGKRYLYDDVPEVLWSKWQQNTTPSIPPSFPTFYAQEIKGNYSYKEADDCCVEPASTLALLDQYKALMHYADTTVGLWATDVPDKVSDPDKVLFQLTAPMPVLTEWNIYAELGVRGVQPGASVEFTLGKTLHAADGKYSSIIIDGHIFVYEDNQWLRVMSIDKSVPYAHVITAVPYDKNYIVTIRTKKKMLFTTVKAYNTVKTQ